VTKPVLAGLLALLLLVVGIISVNHSLHQSLHNDKSANTHFCLFCSFAKGQVNVADVALIAAVRSFFHLCAPRLANPSPFTAVDYRLSPSRAPPSFLASITVVG
jgi:hypothetical protein